MLVQDRDSCRKVDLFIYIYIGLLFQFIVSEEWAPNPKLVIQTHLEMLNIVGSKEGFLDSGFILG